MKHDYVDKETLYLACLLAVGPEPLDSEGRRRWVGNPTLASYMHEIDRWIYDMSIEVLGRTHRAYAWDFINWQRKLK